jgi:hypothetical protein
VDPSKDFRFVAEKVFSIPGRGIVVSGRVERGTLNVGDELSFMATDGKMENALVLAIEVSRRLVEEVEAGQSASLLLEGPRKDQIAIGTVFIEAPEAPPTPVSYAPVTSSSTPMPQTSQMPESVEPINPPSSSWRTLLFILLGILIFLVILFLQGKWDPQKRFAAINKPPAPGTEIHQPHWSQDRGLSAMG